MEIRTNYLNFYSPEEWEKIIEDYERSGLSVPAYSKKKRIPLSSLYGWKYKLRPSSHKHLKQTEDKWIKIMEDWQKSGMAPFSYCKEKKIPPSAFYSWQSKLVPSLYNSRKKIPERWKKTIEDWQKSGLSKNVYCQEKELYPDTFSRWQKRLNFNIASQKTLQEKWSEIINDWQQSGLKRGTYCRKKKLERIAFYKWEKKLRSWRELTPHSNPEKGESQPNLQESFTSLFSSPANSVESSYPTPKIQLTFPQGHYLILEGSFNQKKLSSWLNLLLYRKG